MDARNLDFIAAASGGRLVSGAPDVAITRISTDSRQIKSGDLFVALSGERHDGHAFVSEVAAHGAAAVMIERNRIPESLPGCPVVAVADTRRALGALAARYRGDFALPVTVVGGSNGKTTTKELIAAVLRQRFTTLWSDASFNNDIGVPMTLLRLDKTHEAAVLEAGTNHPGELAPLVKMIQPRFGVVTNLGREHLEFFGDLTGVADEEGWLAELLPADGRLFVNGDDEWTPKIIARTRASVVRVGLGEGNHWRARRLIPDKQGASFRVTAPHSEYTGGYRINLLGRHQVVNALFAIAVGAELGLEPDEIRRGLAVCLPAKMRLQMWEANGVRVLDDAYNANADSVIAALETLRDLPCKGRRVAVLGDMAELGPHSHAAHEEVGRRAAELGVAQLFAVGSMASVTGGAARAAGLARVFEFGEVETAVAALKTFLKPGDVLLLKASRSARLERIADALRQGEAARKN